MARPTKWKKPGSVISMKIGSLKSPYLLRRLVMYHLATKLFSKLKLAPCLLIFGGLGSVQEGFSIQNVLLYDYSVTGGNIKARMYLRGTLSRLAQQHAFSLETIRHREAFPARNLEKFDVIIFSNGDGDVITAQQQQALDRYMRGGGGFIAIHAAGMYVKRFPLMSSVIVKPYYRTAFPSMQGRVYADSNGLRNQHVRGIFDSLPFEVLLVDRWVSLKASPRGAEGVTILFSVDEKSYSGPFKMKDHPVVWARKIGLGKAVYNSLGNENVYTQSDGFGRKLLWNLMKYVSADSLSAQNLAKTAIKEVPEFNLLGKSLALVLPMGGYVVSISDVNGRVLQSQKFQGPGSFRMAVPGVGTYVVKIGGPSVKITRKIIVGP
jgi:type 1 glutamine amidotransferase